MIKVQAIKRHSHPRENRLVQPGEQYYDVHPHAEEKEMKGIVAIVHTKDVNMRSQIQTKPSQEPIEPNVQNLDPQHTDPLQISKINGQWFYFNDDTKVFGKSNAMEKLGMTEEEFDDTIRDFSR